MATSETPGFNRETLHKQEPPDPYTEEKFHPINEIKLGTRERSFLNAVVEATDVKLAYLDREFNFVWVNAAYAKSCHLHTDDLIGKNHFALYPHPENEAIFRHVRDTGESVFYKDKPFLFPDQPQRGVTYWDWSLVPVKDSRGTVVGLVLSLRETTDYKLSELKLQESEARLRTLVDNLPFEFWAMDVSGRYTVVNPACEAAWGVRPGTTPEAAAPRPKTLQQWQQNNKRAFAGEVVTGEVTYEHNENIRTMHNIVAPIRVGSEIRGILGVNIDVTERKQAEDALRESENRFRLALKNSPVLVAMQDIDLVYRWAYNTRTCRPEEVIGKTDADLFAPEDLPGILDIKRGVLRTGRETRKRGWRSTRNGHRVYLDCYYEPLKDPAGRIVGVGIAAVNLTEQRMAEEALRETEQKLALTVSGTQIGIFDRNIVTGQIQSTEQNVRLLGLRTAAPASTTTITLSQSYRYSDWQKCLYPDDLARVEAEMNRCMNEHAAFESEYRVIHPDGSLRWLAVRAIIQYDEASVPQRMLGMLMDITDRKQAEEQSRRWAESLERMVRIRTTEVTDQANQLRALAGQLSQAEQRERKRLAKILHDNIQQLIAAARMRLSGLKRNADPVRLLSTARETEAILLEAIEASRSLAIDLSPPILHEEGLAKGLVWLASHMYDKHQLHVNLQIDNRAEPYDEDVRLLLFECVREFLFNIVKHAGVFEANLTLTNLKDGRIKFIIADSGKGFDVDKLKTRRADEMSFGLFSIRERLACIGGQLEIQSSPGKGTWVELIVPMGESGVPEKRTAVKSIAPPAGIVLHKKTRACRVLICDDHKLFRDGLVRLLQFEPDMEVSAEAADGPQAIALCQALKPDIVLMDVNLGKMGGVEATRQIVAANPDTRVIGLSMYDDKGIVEAMRKAGAVAYMTKTIPVEDLVATMRAHACVDPPSAVD